MKKPTLYETPSDVFKNSRQLVVTSIFCLYSFSVYLKMKLSKMNHMLLTPKKLVFLALSVFFLGYSSLIYSQATPVITMRFANPHYDCVSQTYCVDVEYLSDTPGQQLFGTNVRFFYPFDILGFVAFSDYQGGYGPVMPDPPTVLNSAFAGPALFNFAGSADFVNGAIQLTNPMAPPIILSTVNWTKIFKICFVVNDPNANVFSFCPSIVFDLEQVASNGGFLAGDDGIVITLVDPAGIIESVPADEQVVQFNWMYSGPGTPPYGMPIEEICTTLGCPPLIVCSVDTTIECDQSTDPAFTGFATATDDCPGEPTITYSDVNGEGNCPNIFTITRRWIAANQCGLFDTCYQLIAITDTTAPTILCPTDVTIECANQVPTPDPGSVGTTDNCAGVGTVTFVSDIISNQLCANRFNITRTYRATDACGNSSTCNQTIVVFDIAPPSLTCPPAITVDCASQVPNPDPGSVTSTDNCGGAATITHIGDATTNQTCANRFIVTRTYRATDECGNSATCNQTITVFDNTPPQLTCPQNLTLQCASDLPAPDIASVTATDNCGGGSTIAHVGDAVSGQTCTNRFTVTRTYRATDECGNSATCNQTITINDNTPPNIFCPSNVTVQCASLVPTPTTQGFEVSDNCGGQATVTHVGDNISGQTCTNRYTITRTYRATDDCGNSATCNQTITVFDNTAPMISCPPNITIECSSSTAPGVANGTATATDNCNGTGPLPEVWINEFHYDNVSTDVGEFIEVAGPAGTDLSSYGLYLYNGTGGALYTTTPLSGIIPNQSNGFGTMAFLYPVNGIQNGSPDGIALVKNGTTVIQFLSYEGVFVAVGGPANGMLSTDVIVQELGVDQPGLSLGLIGVGNMYSNFFWFGPNPQSPGAINPGQTILPITGPVISASDVIVAGACPQEYTITRTWRATDACGNSSTCNQTIFVHDTTVPAITCPANVTFQCASQVPAVNIADVIASDNCSLPTVTLPLTQIFPGTCNDRFIITRTYQATDACGNSATCIQTITIFDDTPPTITCPVNVTVQCASLVPAVNTAGVTTSDNCVGAATVTFVSDVISNQTCTNRFTVTRTYQSTDACGNSATCAQIISVFDNTPPSITCPPNVTVQCASLVPAPNTALVSTSDNCSGTATVAFVSDVISNQTCTNRYTLTRTYRSTDVCGNSATCAQIITVFDNTAPTITCPANITVQCANAVPVPNPASVQTSDNCGATATVTFVSDVISNQTCVNRYTLTRTYRSTDACGNSATCTQIISVFDNTAPVITFTDPLLVGVANGGRVDVQCFGQDPNWELPSFSPNSVSASDNCSGNVTVTFTQIVQDEGNCAADGYIVLYRLTWTATDACGNSSSKFVFLALVDHVPPVIHGVPDDVTVNCDEIPAVPTEIWATDECLCACVILFHETSPAPGCQNGQVIMRSWTAKDDCGNQTVEVQKITLIDNKGPVLHMTQPELEGIADGTVLNYTCNEGGIPHFYDLLNAESVYSLPSCGSTGMVTFDKNIIISNNCKYWHYIEQRTYHWNSVDKCGNETNLTIIVRLVDTEAPVLIGVPEITCVDDPALKNIEATDNCGNPFIRFWDVKIPSPCGAGIAWRRTYEAFDDCGNMSRDTVILIPNDHTHPNLQFVNPILKALEFGEILIVECGSYNGNYTPFGPEDVVVMNSCSAGLTVQFHEKVMDTGNCSNGIVAVLELQWTASDICGNLTVETIIAHVVDHTPPVLVNFKPDVTIGCNESLPEIKATDNCSEVSINIETTTIPGACEFEYDLKRMITATDACGNTTTKLQTVHVGDGSGPIIEGVVKDVCNDLSIPNVTAFDPCSGKFVKVTMDQDTLDIPCRDGIVVQRTWSALDACGNATSIVQRIIVGDHTPPVIMIPTYSIILDFLDAVGKNLVYLSQTEIIDKLNALDDSSVYVKDDCDQQIIPVFTLDVTYAGNCQEDGYFEHRVYTWIATDVCGNSSSISFIVDIMDDIPPVFSEVPSNTTIICQPLPSPPAVIANDPAQPVTNLYTQVIEPGNGAGEFNVTRTWTATDACGNSAVVSQHIRWIPDTQLNCDILVPAMVQCNSHGVVIGSNVIGGLGDITYLWEVVGEKCFIQSGQGTPEIHIYIGWTEVQIILTVTDAYGCSSICTVNLDCVVSPGNPFAGLSPVTNPMTVLNPVKETGKSDSEMSQGPYLTQLNLWPNPANGSVNLSFDCTVNQKIQFSLMNLLGQVVLSDEIEAIKGLNTHTVDIAQILEGSYLMQVKSDREMYSKVVVILRND